MNRVYPRCPQCQGKECSDLSCKFSGRKHEDAAPQESARRLSGQHQAHVPPDLEGPGEKELPAVAAPDIGYECAWPR